jgi:hypothetical protein
MASNIKAGQAYVEIATKQGSFDKGMAQVQAAMARLKGVATTMGTGIGKGFASAQGALGGFSKSVLSLPAAIAGSVAVTGLVALAKNFADAGSAVDDMAQRTGMSAEAVSSLGYAAKLSGTDIGTLEKGVRKMQMGIADAAAGVPGAADKFAALGLSVADLQKMSPDEQFIAIADKLSLIQDPALKSAAAMEYFGKAGADLVPMLSGGAEEIRKLQQDAADLGQTMSGEDAAAAAKLGDVFDRLFGVIGGLQTRIGSALAPLLTAVGEKIISVVSNVSKFIGENQELIVTIAKWTAVGAGLLAGLFALGGAAAVASVAMTGLAAIGGAIATVFGMIVGLITAIVSPIGLVIVGVTAAAGAFLYFSGVGGEMVNSLVAKFNELKSIVLPVFDAIKTALMSGQWQAAGQIAMTGLQLVFRVATRDIYAGWLSMVTKLQNAWTDLSSTVSQGAVSFVANLINVLAGIPTGIQNGFGTVFTWLQGTFDQTVNFIAKRLLYLYSLFDKSVDYEKAAKQMDTEANKRADNRQQSLDDASAKRNEDLQRANQGRLGVANEMNRGIQSQADATKQGRDDRNKELLTGFDSQIEQLRKDLADQTKSIQQTADEQAKTAETSKFAQEKPAPERPKIPTVEQVKSTTATQTAGTFSGFAAGMIGSTTSALDRMADQSAKSNELLTQIAKNTGENQPLVFGS